jgi:hypothetical protein
MKKLLTILLCLIAYTNISLAQVKKSLTKSINKELTSSAYVLLPGKVHKKEWDKDFIRITTHIEFKNIGESASKYLIKSGRYSIEYKTDISNKNIVILMPNIKQKIIVGGNDLKEKYYFEICVPKDYKLIIKLAESSSNMVQ